MYAKHARHILKNALIVERLQDCNCDVLVGTTAKVGTDYHLPRSPIKPCDLAEALSSNSKVLFNSIGLVFGREGTGLRNDELALCDFTVTIPCSKKYGTMNLSHAIGIILYELFQETALETTTSHIRAATFVEHERALALIEDVLASLPFVTEQKRETQRAVWKRVLGRSFLTGREMASLMGFFSKVLKAVRKL